MKEISSRISYIEPDHSLDRPLLAYIKGERFSMAFDAGASEDHVKLFYRELEKENLPLPELTVISHAHWDHSYGIHAIHGMAIANEKTYEYLKKDSQTSKEDIFFSSFDADYDFIRKEYGSPENIIIKLPDIIFRNSLTIDLGDVKAELHHIPSPHTDDSTILCLKEERILFAGDASSGTITSKADLETGGIYDKEKTRAYLTSITALNPLFIINSHEGAVSAEEEIEYLKSKL